jgi:hypothetical protein
VPQDLSREDAREYERRVVSELRREMIGGQAGLIEIDAVELLGARPDTVVLFRYHHRPQYLVRDPVLVAGPRAELARLWEFAIDEDDQRSNGFMDGPGVLAAAIGSSFDAAELPVVDPETFAPDRPRPERLSPAA